MPFVLSTHGSLLGFRHYLPVDSRWAYRLYDALTLRSAVRGAAAVIVSSQLEKRDALRFGVPQDRIRVIPMGIDLPDLPPERETSLPLRLLFAGRIARVRQVEVILRAVARLPFDWTLTLAGGEGMTTSMAQDGYLKELKQLAAELRIEDRVCWTGPLPHEKMAEHYRNANLFLYTSQYENFGQPLLEAAAHGLPLISTRVGAANELIEEGQTGYFTDDTPETLSRRIEQLTDPETRRQLGQTLRQKVGVHFSWEKIMGQYLELYRDLTGCGGL